MNGAAVDAYLEAVGVEAVAAALPARLGRHVLAEFFPYRLGIGLLVTALEIGDQTLEGFVVDVPAVAAMY